MHIGATEYIKRIATVTPDLIETPGLAEVRRRLLDRANIPIHVTPDHTDKPFHAFPSQTDEPHSATPYQVDLSDLSNPNHTDTPLHVIPIPAVLPSEYRTDFEATMTGRTILKYLTQKRGMSLYEIEALDVGYAIDGDCAGSAIFPVIMNGDLVFWQARRVLYQTRGKYEGPRIDRSGVLYGYDWLKADPVYLVEGIFDAIALKPYSVALLGKTITDKQIALLAEKNIGSVRVVLDGDAWDDCQNIARTIRNKLWTVRHVQAIRLHRKIDPADTGSTQKLETLAIYRKIF